MEKEERGEHSAQEAENPRDVYMQEVCAVSEVNSELADNGDENYGETRGD